MKQNKIKTEGIKALRKLLDYTEGEEDSHFWQNCECEDVEEILDLDDLTLCKCDANKGHIFRDIVKVRKWYEVALRKKVKK